MNTKIIAVILGITLLAAPVSYFYFGPFLTSAEFPILKMLMYVALGASLLCFIVGELTNNNSQVDKLWSILPIIYVWMVAAYGGFTIRLVLMAILVTIWGVRLTANFALKGAYHWKFWTGEEDYRWKVLRERDEFKPHWKWMIFNLLFICLYQNVLILLFTLPSIIALQFANTPISWIDYAATALMLFFIAFETISDIQQRRFQTAKWSMIKAGQELPPMYKKGFLDRGLWSYSRHPNYFAEQAIWVSFYIFSIAAGAGIFNWTIIGSLLLIVLFQGSSAFGEEISSGKYPEYQAYQMRVSKIIPFFQKNAKE
jgi:steroid 5-alpha reductase family enzyme